MSGFPPSVMTSFMRLKGGPMRYQHLLVAVAVTQESHRLVAKAVSIARPLNASISLITLATDPEMYTCFAAPMLENLREIAHEETRQFLRDIVQHAGYPIAETVIASGELSEHINHFCRTRKVDLVLCGNHNHSFFSRATCSAKNVIGNTGADVLLVALT